MASKTLMNELPALAVEHAEDSLRRVRAAYKCSPDYATISGAVAAAGVALAASNAMASADVDCFGFAVDSTASAVRQLPLWKNTGSATPDYGAIATAAALVSHAAEIDAASAL